MAYTSKSRCHYNSNCRVSSLLRLLSLYWCCDIPICTSENCVRFLREVLHFIHSILLPMDVMEIPDRDRIVEIAIHFVDFSFIELHYSLMDLLCQVFEV